jgi:hypothetical protein
MGESRCGNATRLLLAGWFALACSTEAAMARERAPSKEEALAAMKPYRGASNRGVDVSTLTGKVMCGYQGWFAAEGDGAGRGWVHYSKRGRFEPGRCTIDLWPDVSELDPDEKYPTAFRHKDGSVAHVFSSYNRKTVLRHFRWMKKHGIDGAFVQRFATSVVRSGTKTLRHRNVVLAHCREGANLEGRAYAVMYDLSGLKAGEMKLVIEDWKLLVDRMRITKDKAYLRHKGRPVVAVWGIGFSDGRKYTLDECMRLVEFLKRDGSYGPNTVMLGIPTWWRELKRDCVGDRKVHDIILKADIVSPWTVGRYRDPAGVARHATGCWKPDVEWCRARGKDYLPVVFPGFSWHNMKTDSKLDAIPRLGGRFLWKQYAEAKRSGATMIYQAMFDEVDEATAIFKCTSDPPVGASPFLTYDNLPPDHYLWLVGEGARMLRGEIPVRDALPVRRGRR